MDSKVYGAEIVSQDVAELLSKSRQRWLEKIALQQREDRFLKDEPAAFDVCRRDLANRMDQFLMKLERADQAPTRGETYDFVTALSCFARGEFEKGHGAIDKAERDAAQPPEASDLAESDHDFTAAQLRGAFRDRLDLKK